MKHHIDIFDELCKKCLCFFYCLYTKPGLKKLLFYQHAVNELYTSCRNKWPFRHSNKNAISFFVWFVSDL